MKINSAVFFYESKAHHGDTYDYTKTQYVGLKTKVNHYLPPTRGFYTISTSWDIIRNVATRTTDIG